MSADAAPTGIEDHTRVHSTRVSRAVTDLLYSANHRDIDGLFDCFQSSGLVIQSGRHYVGLDAIRDWAVKTFIVDNASLSQLWFATNGNSAAVRARMTSRHGTTTRTFVFDVEGTLIRTLRVIF